MLSILAYFLILQSQVDCAKILSVVPTPSYSHQIVFHPIWIELSKRGHQLTLLTTDPIKDPTLVNLTEIDLHYAYNLWNIDIDKNILSQITAITEALSNVIEYELEHPEVKKLVQNEDEHFDLVIVEAILPEMMAFSKRFNCPLVGVVSMSPPNAGYALMGNPVHPVLYPDVFTTLSLPLNFMERIVSVLISGGIEFIGHIFIGPKSDSVIKKYFGSDYPSVYELGQTMCLLLVNSDPLLSYPRPLVPNTILIGGGIHMKPKKLLPKDIEEFLGTAKSGAIYLSLGTNVRSRHVSESLKRVFIETFKELPYKILWKFDEEINDLPSNVKLVKWCSQQDVLRHPNVKAFITQGGLQSTEEAVMSHIPIIGIPFFGDQLGNIRRMVRKGVGLFIDKDKVDKDLLGHAIREVVNNTKYKENVRQLATLILDQPIGGLEKAVWWIEYVLRHKGADHLKSNKIPTYQYYLLDVLSFIIITISVVLYILVKIVKFAFRCVFYKKSKIKKS